MAQDGHLMTPVTTLAVTMTEALTDLAMADSCYLRITHIIHVKQKNRQSHLYIFSVCRLQSHFLPIGIIVAIQKAITQASKNVRADGYRLLLNKR